MFPSPARSRLLRRWTTSDRARGGSVRNNPLIFEIDLGFAVDLGVVTIDRARVRLRFEPPGALELTAFGASIDIPLCCRAADTWK